MSSPYFTKRENAMPKRNAPSKLRNAHCKQCGVVTQQSIVLRKGRGKDWINSWSDMDRAKAFQFLHCMRCDHERRRLGNAA